MSSVGSAVTSSSLISWSSSLVAMLTSSSLSIYLAPLFWTASMVGAWHIGKSTGTKKEKQYQHHFCKQWFRRNYRHFIRQHTHCHSAPTFMLRGRIPYYRPLDVTQCCHLVDRYSACIDNVTLTLSSAKYSSRKRSRILQPACITQETWHPWSLQAPLFLP